MDRRYQVFVSSTYLDLVDARREVATALLRSDCFPAGMELFPAADDPQLRIIKRIIDESDYYLLIIAGRYGSIDPHTGVSYTELEYEYAVRTKKPIIAFLHRDPRNLPAAQRESTDAGWAALDKFRSRLSTDRVYKHWETPKELAGEVLAAVMSLKRDKPATGWVKGPSVPQQTRDISRPGTSDRAYGRYTRDRCGKYLGYFYAYRRTFRMPQAIDRSLLEFSWLDERSLMTFTDTQTYPTANGLEVRVHAGEVYFNDAARLVHLLTTDNGALRMLTLTQLLVDEGLMLGMMLTQIPRGNGYLPSVTPIALHRHGGVAVRQDLMKNVGVIPATSPEYAGASDELLKVERDFGVFAVASPPAPEDRPAQTPLLGEAQPEIRPPLKH